MSDKVKVFQSFKTFADTEPIVDQLTDEEAGRIFKACYGCYFRGETLAFRPNDDRMFRAAWGTFEMKLLSEREKDSKTSESRSAAGRQGGLANAKNRKQEKASANGSEQKEASAPTYTDTGTGTNSSTATISSTVTNTEQADPVPADQLAASAAADAEPPAGDLFSVEQLLAKAKKNKVNLTEEGVRAFHDEMHRSGWMLYQKPVEKKMIVRTLRGWAKYNPEYNIEDEVQEDDMEPWPDGCKRYFKEWLSWNGYGSTYTKGMGSYDEEISIDENLIQDVIWGTEDTHELTVDIRRRAEKMGVNEKEFGPILLLSDKWRKGAKKRNGV